jgi:signal transduction histidine kinase
LAQLKKKRTALALYSILLVLPTFVLGGLHWRQLSQEQSLELAEMPLLAEASRGRLVAGVRTRLQALLETENQRPFNQYQRRVYPEELLGPELAFVPSELTSEKAPDGILAWFAWDFREQMNAPYEIFPGGRSGWEERDKREQDLSFAIEELIAHDWMDGFPKRITRLETLRVTDLVPLSFAVINLTEETDLACLSREEPALRKFDDEFVEIYQYEFHVRFYVDDLGQPRLLATRLILVDGKEELAKMPECYSNLALGATLIQGFFIDPQWLFGDLPSEVARQVLREPESFHPAGTPPFPMDENLVVEEIYLVEELDFETYEPQDSSYGGLQVTVSTEELRQRHHRQTRGFLMVALMLLVTLSTGMLLLLRSVKRDLDQAARTENFVAAVTHELRTPVSAIRLYGEMLRDGWAPSEEKRLEYYGRIVHEANRLETMVERVLEKSHVTSVESKPQPGDLNEFIEETFLVQTRAPADLRLELSPELPPVLMNPEAIRSIVLNLVENARKYAPPPAGCPTQDRILLRTFLEGGRPILEVLDRGPGIPAEEKALVFEAFYRRGDEATRKSKGTGLGLHLVKIQAQAVGGNVELRDRPGGGCIFRVKLQAATETLA